MRPIRMNETGHAQASVAVRRFPPGMLGRSFSRPTLAASVLAIAVLVAQHGFVISDGAHRWLHWAEVALAGWIAGELLFLLAVSRRRVDTLRRFRTEYWLLGMLFVGWAAFSVLPDDRLREVAVLLRQDSTETVLLGLVQLYLFGNVCVQLLRVLQWVVDLHIRPEWVLAGSFAGAILIGTLLLLLPRAATDPAAPIHLTDAVFTATSAVCVTGLVVRDTGTEFSTFGQVTIMALFQVGGLGIVTFVAFISVFSAKSLPVTQMVAFRHMINAPTASDLKRRVIGILLVTVAIEAAGAALLWSFLPAGPNALMRLKWSVFHTVSAFCNAGFALQGDSLESMRADWRINAVVMTLIVLGGLGYLVLPELAGMVRRKARRQMQKWMRLKAPPKDAGMMHLSVQTKLALWTTLALIAVGAVGFGFLEAGHLLAPLDLKEQAVASLFQSITARTAGFNTVPMGELRDATLILIMMLMIIGACPVSMGGGIKTVTFAILLLAVRSMITQRPRLEAFGRAVSAKALFAALSVFVLYMMALAVTVFLLALFDPDIPLRDELFESISALSTVGLSTGITAQLSVPSKWVLCAAMFIGRVGPISLVLSIFLRKRPQEYDFPEEDVVVG